MAPSKPLGHLLLAVLDSREAAAKVDPRMATFTAKLDELHLDTTPATETPELRKELAVHAVSGSKITAAQIRRA
jgi:hypothetical protein